AAHARPLCPAPITITSQERAAISLTDIGRPIFPSSAAVEDISCSIFVARQNHKTKGVELFTTPYRSPHNGRARNAPEKFRKDILLMSGLSQHDVGIGGPDGPGDHARAVGTYLTGERIRKTQG